MTEVLKVISPIDGRVYVERPLADEKHSQKTFLQARQAAHIWQAMTLKARAALCHKAIDHFVANNTVIAEELCWQMGRPIRYGAGEVAGVEERARYMIEIAEEALAPIVLSEKPGFERWVSREPLGIVFVIAPWNYPYLTAINAIIPALMAGNTVVLKHSSQTPLCAERLVDCFEQAGLPKGVLQYLHLSHSSTEAILESGDIDYVAFTGSVAAGIQVEQATAGRFIGVGLELGGKDPAYIRADADIDQAVETVIDGAFFNAGQSCCGIERLYVHDSVYDQVLEKAIAAVSAYTLGRSDDESTTLGPLVRTEAAHHVRRHIEDAVEKGAVAHIDASDFPMSQPGTPYLAPQLLSGVDHAMRVMTEESFGPVLGVQRVHSDQEAIALMNDSDFGLTSAIFTRNKKEGIALGQQLQTGTFFLNRCDYLDPGLAWTGIKQSGRGCTLSRLGYEALTRPKSFHIKEA